MTFSSIISCFAVLKVSLFLIFPAPAFILFVPSSKHHMFLYEDHDLSDMFPHLFRFIGQDLSGTERMSSMETRVLSTPKSAVWFKQLMEAGVLGGEQNS
jgi:hypothetical protein